MAWPTNGTIRPPERMDLLESLYCYHVAGNRNLPDRSPSLRVHRPFRSRAMSSHLENGTHRVRFPSARFHAGKPNTAGNPHLGVIINAHAQDNEQKYEKRHGKHDGISMAIFFLLVQGKLRQRDHGSRSLRNTGWARFPDGKRRRTLANQGTSRRQEERTGGNPT